MRTTLFMLLFFIGSNTLASDEFGTPRAIYPYAENQFVVVEDAGISIYGGEEIIKQLEGRFKVNGSDDFVTARPVAVSSTEDKLWVLFSDIKGKGFKNPGCEICYGKDYDHAYVQCVNRKTLEVEGLIEVGSYPKFLEASTNGNYLVVSNHTSKSLSIIDAKTQTLIKNIDIDGIPTDILIDPQERYAFVGLKGEGAILKINLQTLQSEKIGSLKGNYDYMEMSPQGRYIYAASKNGRYLDKIDLVSNSVVKHVTLMFEIESMALDESGWNLLCQEAHSNQAIIYSTRYFSNTIMEANSVLQSVSWTETPGEIRGLTLEGEIEILKPVVPLIASSRKIEEESYSFEPSAGYLLYDEFFSTNKSEEELTEAYKAFESTERVSRKDAQRYHDQLELIHAHLSSREATIEESKSELSAIKSEIEKERIRLEAEKDIVKESRRLQKEKGEELAQEESRIAAAERALKDRQRLLEQRERKLYSNRDELAIRVQELSMLTDSLSKALADLQRKYEEREIEFLAKERAWEKEKEELLAENAKLRQGHCADVREVADKRVSEPTPSTKLQPDKSQPVKPTEKTDKTQKDANDIHTLESEQKTTKADVRSEAVTNVKSKTFDELFSNGVIVVGSFSNLPYAETFSDRVKAKGYTPIMYKVNNLGYVKVAIPVTSTAAADLKKIRKEINKSAWLLYLDGSSSFTLVQ